MSQHRTPHLSRRAALAGLTSLGLNNRASAQPAIELPVVASFSILADLVRNVGRERIRLTTLIGPGVDAHVYTPTPADARAVKDARLVVINGLKFEGWTQRLIRASGTKAFVVEAARGVRTIVVDENSPAHDHGDHSHAGENDPHAWQSLANAKVYVANIRDGLVAIDPDGWKAYEANAAAYGEELGALDAEIKTLVAKLPDDRRKVITSHDAFGYFGHAYGLSFIAPQGVSTASEASARDVARIIQQIRRDKISAVFLENIADQRLTRRIAEESGARIGGTLYSDGLSPPDGPAATYIAMMRHNARTIVAALAPG
jgi:zinc/manganese transport system substrate-binding protein